jgi:hypothetical protein
MPPISPAGFGAGNSSSSSTALAGPQCSAGGTTSGLGLSPLGPHASAGMLNPGALGLPGVRVSTPGLPGGPGGPTALTACTPGGSARGGSGRGSGAGGFFNPVGSGAGAGDVLLSQWRENLAIMASNRTAGDVEAILQLGDRLLAEQGQVGLVSCNHKISPTANTCYIMQQSSVKICSLLLHLALAFIAMVLCQLLPSAQTVMPPHRCCYLSSTPATPAAATCCRQTNSNCS